jgi:glycosyltransferase involved in cell wall biosynthesis
MHEYFLLCPSPFLLDNTGSYCGVPALVKCDTCLSTHQEAFVSLTGERSLRNWRALWGEFLEAAEEVRCFSESSRRLLARAYPDVAGRATLRPHPVEPLRPVRNSRTLPACLTVGVIGAISQHKGAGVVAELAQAIVDADAPVRIVVIGNLDASCPPEVVRQTGPYRRGDLPSVIEKHKIDIALLPSICPETFSYVAHEIVAMGLPLVCLDLGAQADLARSQPAGRVAQRQDGPGLLEEIIALDRHLHPLSLKVLS